MKYFLINPELKWFKANLHCHSTNSDGFYSPMDIKRIYKKHGYKIVAFSDHEVIYDSSFLTDKNFVAITATEYSINQTDKPANKTYIKKTNKVSGRHMKTMHLCLFAKDEHNVLHPAASKENFSELDFKKYGDKKIQYDGYKRIFTPESIQETINRANKAGFLIQLNHPNWSLNEREDYINLKGLWGLEVLNYLTEIETGAEYCINIYDDMLREGHKIFCTMGDDNHNYRGGYEGSFGGFNYIGVESLTYKNVIKAMEKGDIYASNGPRFKSIVFDSDTRKVFINCTAVKNIIYSGYNRSFAHTYGRRLTSAWFEVPQDEPYFRITIKDKYGHIAHTHAFFLDDIK